MVSFAEYTTLTFCLTFGVQSSIKRTPKDTGYLLGCGY